LDQGYPPSELVTAGGDAFNTPPTMHYAKVFEQVEQARRIAAFIEWLRFHGLKFRRIAPALGLNNEITARTKAFRVGAGSPVQLRRQICEKDRLRSSPSEICEYINRVMQDKARELQDVLVMDGSCPPWDPSQPYLFNVNDHTKYPEFTPVSKEAVSGVVYRIKKKSPELFHVRSGSTQVKAEV
jgi:hypothetical protein